MLGSINFMLVGLFAWIESHMDMHHFWHLLLLFVVGLELSLTGLMKTPWRIYLIAILQVLLTSTAGFVAGTGDIRKQNEHSRNRRA